jgi:hypothetical protein
MLADTHTGLTEKSRGGCDPHPAISFDDDKNDNSMTTIRRYKERALCQVLVYTDKAKLQVGVLLLVEELFARNVDIALVISGRMCGASIAITRSAGVMGQT